jgi:hypothetical protein
MARGRGVASNAVAASLQIPACTEFALMRCRHKVHLQKGAGCILSAATIRVSLSSNSRIDAASLAILSRRSMTMSTMTCMASIRMVCTSMEKVCSCHQRYLSVDHVCRSLKILLASTCLKEWLQFIMLTWDSRDNSQFPSWLRPMNYLYFAATSTTFLSMESPCLTGKPSDGVSQ